MKKLLAIIMAVIMAVGFAGCGGVEDVEEIIDEVTKGATIGEFNTTATIEETVLVDENGVKITATDLSYGNYSAKLNLVIENNRDEALEVISGSVGYSCNSVNHCMYDVYLYCRVDAHTSAEDTMTFEYDGLKTYGITNIAVIELGFDIQGEEYDEIYTEPAAIYTSLYKEGDYSEDRFKAIVINGALENDLGIPILFYSEKEFYNAYNTRVPFIAVMANKNDEPAILIDIENSSDEQEVAMIGDIYINGYEVRSGHLSGITLNGGSRGIKTIQFDNLAYIYDGDFSDISSVKTISFEFSVGDTGYTTTGEKVITIDFPEPIEIPEGEDED